MARGNGTKDVQWKNTINAYKGIAAVAIAYFYHYKNEFGGEKPGVTLLQTWSGHNFLSNIYLYGYLGVELFFVISGFIMYYAYFAKIHSGSVKFSAFFFKRISKIFPLFWITTAVALVVQQYNYMKYGEYYITWINDLHHLVMNILGLQAMPGLILGQSFNAPA